MKLELKYLAPYLPYGLKVQTSWSIDGFGGLCTSKVVGLYRDELLLEPHTILHKHIPYRISIDRTSLDDPDTKPILLPMSSLYTEMEDGTVPIVELAKIEHSCSVYHILRNKVVEVAGDNQDSMSFKYDLDDNYFINSNFDCDYEYYPIMYQLDLFTYLFSNHFDVWNLIDKGLALDKTKIK